MNKNVLGSNNPLKLLLLDRRSHLTQQKIAGTFYFSTFDLTNIGKSEEKKDPKVKFLNTFSSSHISVNKNVLGSNNPLKLFLLDRRTHLM